MPILVLMTTLSSGGAVATDWNLSDALALPDWLTVSVEHRTRYETVDNQFRANGVGGDQVIAFRTNVLAEATWRSWRVGGEFIDSRVTLDDLGTPLNTAHVNQAELLQAYLAWSKQDFFGSGLKAELKLGRQTLDLGSRRLLARNRYRNTINNFSGFDLLVQQMDRWQVRSFFVLPVTRLPSDRQSIGSERSELDAADTDIFFTGIYLAANGLPWEYSGEIYALYLNEDDTDDAATRNRRLFTPGGRLYREAARGAFDYELESAVQVGKSRSSTAAANTNNLDHFAFFGHAAIGYTFDVPWTPRLVLQYDYASGDENPNDDDNERFDTLFGARRFEFGPTSIWGAFARSNINSPGYRLIVQPSQNLSAFVAHRFFWLAEDRDQWTTAGIQDTSGQSGNFISQQLEARIKWDVIPKQVTLETGWAHLFKGGFAKRAPDAPAEDDDSNYFYAQTKLRF